MRSNQKRLNFRLFYRRIFVIEIYSGECVSNSYSTVNNGANIAGRSWEPVRWWAEGSEELLPGKKAIDWLADCEKLERWMKDVIGKALLTSFYWSRGVVWCINWRLSIGMRLHVLLVTLTSLLYKVLSEQQGIQKRVEQFFEASSHTNNWVVLVCTSRFWFNYRHVANVLSLYHSVKRLGIPDRS